MGYVLKSAVDTVRSLLEGTGGIRTQLEQMAAIDPERALLAERFAIRSYNLKRGLAADEELTVDPRIRIQVEKLVNRRSLKFAPFSGECGMVLWIEANGDRQETVVSQLHAITDAVLLVLDNHVGELGRGIYYGGGYELQISPVDRGGRGFQQTAQIRFELAMDDQGEE